VIALGEGSIPVALLGYIDEELRGKSVGSLSRYRRARKRIVKRLRREDGDRQIRFEREGVDRFRKEILGSVVEGIDTHELLRLAMGLGLNYYERLFFAEVINFQLGADEFGKDSLVRESIEKALILESKLKGKLVKFPSIKDGYAEFVAGLSRGKINYVGIGCPDYRKEYELGAGLSEQTRFYIEAVPDFVLASRKMGIKVGGKLLIANTESDLPEVLQRLTKGDEGLFHKRCRQSVKEMEKKIKAKGLSKKEMDFGLLLDFMPDFHERQYVEERLIRERMLSEVDLRYALLDISIQRREKYRSILGREEKDCELTIRYEAQYRALVKYLRGLAEQTGEAYIMFNYQTPNLMVVNEAEAKERIPLFVVGKGD